MENQTMLSTQEAVVGGSGPRAGSGNGQQRPDPAVREKPVRRRFTAEYKLRILHEADRCIASGQLGALLRREASAVSRWAQAAGDGQYTATALSCTFSGTNCYAARREP